MRGIEIREGKPIFYSLGNLIDHVEHITKQPFEFYERFGADPYKGTPADAYDARGEQEKTPQPGSIAYKPWIEDERHYQYVIAKMAFEGNRLSELKLYPVELGQHKPRSQRGTPSLAEPELAEKILEKMQTLSKPYDTKITIEEGVGTVEL
jgi:poly-gamma-glutamate synthesis protein (capsule biosynthesis protein)